MRTPEGRGGARVPSGGPRVSGVGRFARRSDAQPINVPNVGDSEDLKQGDRAKLEAALRQRPLARAPSPRVSAAPRGGNSPAAAGGQALGPPPEHLMGIPSAREGEPLTEGLPFGPGAGPEVLAGDPPDDREFVLQVFSRPPFANEAAAQMLAELQAARVPQTLPLPTMSPNVMAPEPAAPAPVEPSEEPNVLPLPTTEQEPAVEEPIAEEVIE